MENKTKGDDPLYPLSEESAISTYDERLCLQVVNNGMTKREYFAGLAMQAILSKTFNHVSIDDSVTTGAVMYADQLIDELNKRQ